MAKATKNAKGRLERKELLDRIRKLPLTKMPIWFQEMIDEKDRLISSGEVTKLHVYVSKPNRKGAPHSVSTIPVYDCANCSKCALQCYDLRHDTRNVETRRTRSSNSAILEYDPTRFFDEINAACKLLDKFRWHVGGDVKNLDYFKQVVRIAKENSHCTFHLFTKNYESVNTWIREQIELNDILRQYEDGIVIDELIPNLNIRFSGWPGLNMDNPFGIRTAEVVFEESFVKTNDDDALCTGDCTQCIIHETGCFDRRVKRVLLPVH